MLKSLQKYYFFCIYQNFFVLLQPKIENKGAFTAKQMAKIGIFDSGYGGLTILEAIRKELPQYDYLYLGDNARAPYGTHSFDVIYRYTLEAVKYLLDNDCALVILACNTASAKALRTIQQKDLPLINSQYQSQGRKVNVLGVIRPTVEAVPSITKTGHVGILATPATVSSESYVLELEKLSVSQKDGLSAERSVSETVCQRSGLVVTQQSCPLWVPLIEAGEHLDEGADYFVDKYLRELLSKDPQIDTLVLGCTHYPLLKAKIDKFLRDTEIPGFLDSAVQTIAQGSLVAKSLADYLIRHPEYRTQLSINSSCTYLTTENADRFSQSASLFLNSPIQAEHIDL